MAKLKQLYIDTPLSLGGALNPPKEVSRRLSRVLRQKKGDKLALFNGKDGLFEAEIMDDSCKEIHINSILKPQPKPQEVYLLACLVKKDAMDRIYRQATEFGVTDIIPIMSDYTVSDKVNEERVTSLLVEAAEQCERLTIPKLHKASHLQNIIPEFGGKVFWCAEHVGGKWNAENHSKSGDALLVGPEGGFSSSERNWLKSCINVTPVGLGNFILRADTAVCAGLSRLFEYYEQS